MWRGTGEGTTPSLNAAEMQRVRQSSEFALGKDKPGSSIKIRKCYLLGTKIQAIIWPRNFRSRSRKIKQVSA